MKAVVTRVNRASVTIDGKVNGAIDKGFLVLLGVGPDDTEETAVKMADKICGVRVFEDEAGKMNLSLEVPDFPVRQNPISPYPCTKSLCKSAVTGGLM